MKRLMNWKFIKLIHTFQGRITVTEAKVFNIELTDFGGGGVIYNTLHQPWEPVVRLR